jgi:hypothetical protein
MRKVLVLLLTVATFALVASDALAQRGVGDPTGTARLGVQPKIVELSGHVLEVKTEPCGNTTGRSLVGCHFLMKTAAGQTLNIHLGPAAELEFVARELVPGKAVKVHGFRTEKMQQGHYVAQRLAYDGRVVMLRDATLRPVWAGPGGVRTASGDDVRAVCGGFGFVPGRGAGYGRGAGWGAGRGFGRQGR